MTGAKVNNYSQVDTNILELQLTQDANFKGKHLVSLTNYDNTALPAIAAGSIVEVNGALFEFDTEEAIGGSPSNGTVYIVIIPSTTTCTAQFTNTAPTWSDTKQGWYGTGGSANYRYLEFKMTKASTSYSDKKTFTHDDNVELDIIYANSITAAITDTSSNKIRFKVIPIGAWNIVASDTISIPHGLTNEKIVAFDVIINQDTGVASYHIAEGGGASWYVRLTYSTSSITINTSGGFQTTNFDSTAVNRGYVFITYIE